MIIFFPWSFSLIPFFLDLDAVKCEGVDYFLPVWFLSRLVSFSWDKFNDIKETITVKTYSTPLPPPRNQQKTPTLSPVLTTFPWNIPFESNLFIG